jgi:hypothetical protein
MFSRIYRAFSDYHIHCECSRRPARRSRLRSSDASVLAAIPGVLGIRIQHERFHVYTGRSRNIISTASVLADLPGVPGSVLPTRAFSRLYRVFPEFVSNVSVLTYIPGVPGSSPLSAQEHHTQAGYFSRTTIRETRRAANLRHRR